MDSKSETKYERLRKIGIGSYGVVFKCANRQTGQIVAIKRYSENDTDPIIRKIAMREVRMLRQLKHPNLIHLIEVFRRKRILHLVFDYCELTVLDVIDKYANNCPLNLIKKIIWQLVNGVSHCHAHNCIHRDIKPENILINQAGVVKLCDFGFARNMNPTPSRVAASMSAKQIKYEREAQLLGVSTGQMSQFMALNGVNGASCQVDQQQACYEKNKENQQSERQALTEYVATRWYRAPELLVGDVYYGKKIDIWAIGCVTAELMRGEPVWPGKTDFDQLCMIKNSLGSLTPGQTHTLLTQGLYDQANMERLLNQVGVTEPLERKLPTRVGQTGFEFVFACLQMDPSKRPNCDELLQHDYIQSAQMTQFVRGTSHATTGPVGAEQVTLASSGRVAGLTGSIEPPSSRSSHSSLGYKKSQGASLRETGRAVPLERNELVARSNSQAILMIANTKKQQQQQQQQQQRQQPAFKRLVIASDSGIVASPKGYQSSPKHSGSSLVPVPVRTSKQATDIASAARGPAGWLHDDSPMTQQNQYPQAEQQYKRKKSQASGRGSITGGQSSGALDKSPAHRGASIKSTSHQRQQQSYVQRRVSRVSLGSPSGERKQSQSNINLYRSTGADIEPNRRGQYGKSKGPGRSGGQQQSNTTQQTGHATSTASSKAGQQQQMAGYANTNSSASSSPTTSFSTGKSSSISFLPSVKQQQLL